MTLKDLARGSIAYRVSELERRLANVLRIGTIAVVEPSTARATVQIGELLTDFLPWLTLRAGADRTWWAPTPGEQVVLLSPSGEHANGVILPALYQTAFGAPANLPTKHVTQYADGSKIEHDALTGTITVQGTAKVIVQAAAEVDVTAAQVKITGQTTITGPTTITGEVTISGGVTATGDLITTGDVKAGTHSLSLHTHLYNPGPGSSTPTGLPTP